MTAATFWLVVQWLIGPTALFVFGFCWTRRLARQVEAKRAELRELIAKIDQHVAKLDRLAAEHRPTPAAGALEN